MKQGIESGKYHLGILVEPKQFHKYIVENGEIVSTAYKVYGRKIPLDTIGEYTFKKHDAMGIIRPKDNFSRKLLMWTDHADNLGLYFIVKIH